MFAAPAFGLYKLVVGGDIGAVLWICVLGS